MTPEQRAVIVDALREMGCDAEAQALEAHPNFVERLAALKRLSEIQPIDEEGHCKACGYHYSDGCVWDCQMVEAWRVTGNRNYGVYLGWCWDAAHAEQARRMSPQLPEVRLVGDRALIFEQSRVLERAMYGDGAAVTPSELTGLFEAVGRSL